MIRRFLAALLLIAAPARASWQDVVRADAGLDLTAAREHALATVTVEGQQAEAVAAAWWWLESLELLAEPEDILSSATSPRDPELTFVLARIEGQLALIPPPGTLASSELAGPFGAYDTLDLERDVVPSDPDLPPLGTPWRSPAEPFHLRLRSGDGWIGPPEGMAVDGVYLAAWSLAVNEASSGWLVVEAAGSFDFALDGKRIARVRDCGRVQPAISWLRVELGPGSHRLRVAMSSRQIPRVRLSLLGLDGTPLPLAETASPAAGAARAWAESPPAATTLARRLEGADAGTETLLLAAELARDRGDPLPARRLMERALKASPDDPWIHLALARFFLTEPTGSDPEVDYRRAQEHLRGCGAMPIHLLVEHELARRQRRPDDQERALDRLVEEHGTDARVLLEWVRAALERGWAREAEEGLEQLKQLLPTSPAVAELELDVLAGLERWEERNRLLRALAESEPGRGKRVEQLAAACLTDAAVSALDHLRTRVDDPILDLDSIRLLLEAGDEARAREELGRTRRRWGALPALDQLELALAASHPRELDRVLAEILARDPSDLHSLTLAWRRGVTPFFAPFRVDALAIAAAQAPVKEQVDAVLLLDQAVERVLPDGSSIYYYHGLTRALTPTGAEQAAQLQRMEQATLLDLRIIKPDGRVVVPPELQAGVANPTLSQVEPGDLVEEQFVAAVLGGGRSRRGHLSPYVYRFADPERAFGLSEYALLVPPELQIDVEGRFTGLQYSETSRDGLRVLHWRAESVAPVPPEPFAPPTQELLPWVTYGFGVTWEDVGDGVRDRMLAVLRSSPDLDAWAAPHLAGEDPVSQVRSLVAAICDEIDAGDAVLDLGASGGESFSRRRGNRLGVLAAALAAQGWELEAVLTRPLEYSRSHLKVPTPDAFVVPLLRATRGAHTVWVDLGEERSGVDHISAVFQGSDALVLPLSHPDLPVTYVEALPKFPNPELEERLALQARLDAQGAARLSLTIVLRGAQAERTLARVRGVPEDRVGMVYRQIAASLFPGAENVRGRIERQDDHVDVGLQLDLPGACEVAGGTMTCRSLSLARPLAPSLATLPQRRFPLILQLPVLQMTELDLVPPPGWSEERPPRRLMARWGSLDETLALDDRGLHSTLRLELPAQVVGPEDYPDFARFCHAIDELTARPPTLRRK